MFEDDDEIFDDEWDSLEDLLARFEKLKKGITSSLLDEEDFEQLIEYYLQNSNEEQALLACDIGRTYYPFSSSLLLLKAEVLTQYQKLGQALKVLDEVDQLDQQNIDAVLLRNDIFMAQNKFDKASEWLEQNLSKFDGKEQVELLLELSEVYDELENFNAVFDTLKRIVQKERRNEEALQKICFWADFTGRLEESVAIHTQITEEDPYNTLAWFNLGAAYQSLKFYEKAIDAYEYCIAIDDKFEYAYRNLADAYMRMKWFENAIEVLEKHLEIAKPEDIIYEALGHCFEKKKDFSKARNYYRQAFQLSPKDDSISFKIGETYTKEKKWEKAINAYTVALNLNKENVSYSIAIGNCLMELNIFNEALILYLNAVRLKPSQKNTWIALIRGLYFSKMYKEGLTQIPMAKESCGEKADFFYLHAALLLELGKTKEAMLQLEDGLRLSPSKARSFTQLCPDYLLRSNVADLLAKYKKQ
jgi:tetratricopeptide (TPR) repeat protein